MYAFKKYDKIYKVHDVLVYKRNIDIPNRLPNDFEPTTIEVIKKLAKYHYCYVWEYKSCPSVEILMYETKDTVSDTVLALYEFVNSKRIEEILKKYA